MFIFINPIYTKWSTNPTIVSPESTNYAIWNIYFPAVTICSNNKVLDGQLKRIVKKAPWVNVTENSTGIPDFDKVEIFLEQKEVVFLSPSKICENLNF